MKEVNFNQNQLDEGYEVLRSISHDLRLRIISLINDLEVVNVNEIYKTLNLEQSITSQHLKVLRDSNIVVTKRDGKRIFYSLNHDKISQVNSAIKSFDELTKARKIAKSNSSDKQ
ncbi:MAG TPA: metalloregulator ArsR/SmtB family transcription factor [Chitinophagales bacterium]|nr:metalloregulator ArsR/SmtB family transcription factor [Chitinophagales bacterium]